MRFALHEWGKNRRQPMTGDKDAIKAEILTVLKKHLEGMRLRDLGNSLGVNWRSLVGLVGSLLRQGKIERLNGVYFFVRRKSGRRKR